MTMYVQIYYKKCAIRCSKNQTYTLQISTCRKKEKDLISNNKKNAYKMKRLQGVWMKITINSVYSIATINYLILTINYVYIDIYVHNVYDIYNIFNAGLQLMYI